MTNTTELKEEAQSIAWWLDEQNSQTRKELAERRPELELWLEMIEKKVTEMMAKVKKEETMMKEV